jgi:nucleoside-diphosphate-sugar epimerase
MKEYNLRFVCACILSLVFVEAFEFKMPWDTKSPFPNVGSGQKALQPGDTIAVVGASGNVGKLVALRLSDTYKVNGIVRDSTSVSDFLNRDSITLYEANLLEEQMKGDTTKCPPSLRPALEKANAIVICTGTTAFPTKAWTKSESNSGVAGDVLKALLDNSFDVKTAIASLDKQGFNTPNNIDALSNIFLVNAWKDACKVPRKRIIMLSSIGVQRRDQMPFPVLNACGVLDAKAEGEAAIQAAAQKDGLSYTVIRPGQLFGGPYDNNYYLGTLFQLDKDAKTQDVEVAVGDTLLGDTLRSTLAEVTAQICEGDFARDIDFAVVNVKGDEPNMEQIQNRLSGLVAV